MKLKLMIEGSASVIASILANLPSEATLLNERITGTPSTPAPSFTAMPSVAPSDDGEDDTGPVNTAAPAVDSSGLPWDERIHAATKTTKADGTWKIKKGASALVPAVEAELRAAAGATLPPVAAAPTPAPMAMPTVPMGTMAPPPALPPVAAPAAAPAPAPIPAMPAPVPAVPPMPAPEPAPQPAPAPVAAAPAATGTDFAQFMQHLSGQMTKTDAAGAPLVHADYLAGITNEISTAFAPQGVAPLTAITDIAAHANMITYAIQLMQRDGRW